MAVLADRHGEFLDAGARLFALSADSVGQNAAVMERLALPYPMLADPDRERAITPLGFADENDPRLIGLPGTIVMAPGGEEIWRHAGRDYADRPHENLILSQVEALGLDGTTQSAPERGEPQPGPTAMTVETLLPYLKGAKFATLALRRRHRELGDEFRDDAKELVQRVDRYIEALSGIDDRRGA